MAVDGKWNLTIKTPMGDQNAVLTLKETGGALSGEMSGSAGVTPVENGRVEGDRIKWTANVTSPMPITLEFDGSLNGADIAGEVQLGSFGSSTFSGTAA